MFEIDKHKTQKLEQTPILHKPNRIVKRFEVLSPWLTIISLIASLALYMLNAPERNTLDSNQSLLALVMLVFLLMVPFHLGIKFGSGIYKPRKQYLTRKQLIEMNKSIEQGKSFTVTVVTDDENNFPEVKNK